MVSRAVEKLVFERDRWLCQICGRLTEFRDGEVDHILPRSKGGSDNPNNLEWACHSCNNIKGNRLTNEEVRRHLGLPEDFNELMLLRKDKEQRLKEPTSQLALPILSSDGLDESKLSSCTKALQTSYQEEIKIDEICKEVIAVNELDHSFVHIGMHYRLPRLWFLPYSATGQSYCNDYLFAQLGKEIAVAEQYFLIDSVVKSKAAEVNVGFSPQGILTAMDTLRSNGSEPTILSLPSTLIGSLFDWQGTAHLEIAERQYVLVLDQKTKLKIIFSKDKESCILLNENTVGWRVKSNPQGALYVVLGNHQLYPLKYVQLLTGISVKSVVNPQEAAHLLLKE